MRIPDVKKTVKLEDNHTYIYLAMRSNLVVMFGDSGVGKTFLSKEVNRIQDLKPACKSVLVVNDINTFEHIDYTKCDVIIIDKVEQFLRDDWDALNNCILRNREKYFIIFLRGSVFVPYIVNNMAKLVTEKIDGRIYISLKYYVG